ncbi:ABC transporter permease/substrate-binding protein [Macrococcoides bohemicum]|uniref:Probable ergothioneine transporter EgtUBC n=1 Tax=Macrococcoides bohemicum TaxID=1903056 RepID=A0AAE7Q410_9STAP|nr:ABC transporter permease/substrate-binding protein [Macrococcus bohemicus]QRN49276.1 ABC transporter permease/substrate-binding protein [Macrococcus bohemicus]QYA43039.1 ABC transporter permease/substrate-binding protein [Macrococcus bohemicus]QYA45393.1 ABC transporter permease/substrate-binding protein [Macrococcus bohemicus]
MKAFINTFQERKWELLQTLFEHIQLSFIALLIATLIAIPIGIWLTRHTKIAEPIINIAAIMQTIPSLALLGLMIPFFGIGRVPAIIALVIYALLPILRNTYTGIKEVNPSLKEAAQGIGMNTYRQLKNVEIPIAMPVIMAGIRTAMVLIIGTATLAAFIGAGGLGDLILLGIDRNNMNILLLGAIPAALLALLFDFVLKRMEKLSYRKMMIVTGLLLLSFLLVAIWPLFFQKDNQMKFAGKLGTEPEIITNMYKLIIEDKTDVNVEIEPGMGKTTFLFNALKSDNIDGYLEFTGTVLGEITKEDAKFTTEKEVYQQANESINKKYQMSLLKPMQYNNTYALAVKKEYADKYQLKSISDLQKVKSTIRAGFTLEFNDRMDGYKGIQKKYGIKFDNVRTMEPKIRYQAIEQGKIDLIDAYSTDAELKKYGMVVLKDDKNLFPPYQGAPLLKDETIKEHPEVVKALNQLAGKITDEEMQTMNYAVTYQNKSPESIAHAYLKREKLIK